LCDFLCTLLSHTTAVKAVNVIVVSAIRVMRAVV